MPMKINDIIRAWKDPQYRESLSEEEQSMLPDHPSGMIELSPGALGSVAGGSTNQLYTCDGPCIELTLAPSCAEPDETAQCTNQHNCSSGFCCGDCYSGHPIC